MKGAETAAILRALVPAQNMQGSTAFALIVTGCFAVSVALGSFLPETLVVVPKEWNVPFVDWINGIVKFLRRQPLIFDLTFKDMSRAVSYAIEWPLDFMEGLLADGFKSAGLGPMPWIMLVGLAAVLGHHLEGWRLAALASGTIIYIALFGKWELSMITLSVVLVTAPIAALLGLLIGVLSAKFKPVEMIVWPLLNVLQSLPHFSYLVPVAIFVGVGHRAGAVATILFALPPMTRLTILGVRGVAPEVREAGLMSGCSPAQLLWRVEIPAARPTLMIGVNQVIMQCLAMVVIASFVGAKGLGHDLLFRLQSLRLGQALEIGVVIVLMAIALDRLSQALARKQPQRVSGEGLWQRHPHYASAGLVVAGSLALALIFPAASVYPEAWTVTAAPTADWIVESVTTYLYGPAQILRDGLLIYVLIPMRDLFALFPWVGVVGVVAIAGWRFGGVRTAAICAAFILFIAFSGFWERALITAYMVSFAVFICIVFGLPIGIWASRTTARMRVVQVLCDTFQTFPSFIYLIPVIMLFKVGDVAAISAIVIYAMIPVVRYTMFGLSNVPSDIVDAGLTSGCSQRQLLLRVRLPLAFPEIMLGINQTIMFALFMVIIAAFIGTTDLGQEIFRALSFNDAGKGLVVGLCVAFMGLTADQLIRAWCERKRQALGLT